MCENIKKIFSEKFPKLLQNNLIALKVFSPKMQSN